MKALYDDVSDACSKLTTKAYSTSFSLGIHFLHRRYHKPIYAIYGFVRFADEIVDSFHGYDKHYLLQKFRDDTREAIDRKISLNPILNAFQDAVHRYGIEWELIDTFLKSMEMDLRRISYTSDLYENYILGSAEVVGLMCLHVFTGGDPKMYERLKPSAMRLGAAFQKVNFLRDVKADYEELGRSYFPGVDLSRFSCEDKLRIEAEIENDFNEALKGIRQLPGGARRGVYLAYMYYRQLFVRIKNVPAHRVMQERIRVPNSIKIGLTFNSLLRHKFNLL